MAKRGRGGGRWHRDWHGRFASGGGGGASNHPLARKKNASPSVSAGRARVAHAMGVRSRSARGGFVHVAGSGGRGSVTVFAQKSRTGKTRSMATINTGRNSRGRAVLLRVGTGGKPSRAPFQKGRTKRGLIVVRHGGQSHVSRTYVQKVRVPQQLSPGATRVQRTAFVYSPRR